MSRREAQVVILCEDRQHEVFVRQLLRDRKGKHYCARKIATTICPPGSQAAEQFVRELYPREIALYRRRAARMNLCLILIIDADTYSVQERWTQLAQALGAKQVSPIQPEEAVLVLIPKRNIETWIHYLEGNEVDETSSYRRLKQEGTCKPCATRLSEMCRDGVPDDAPDSLKRACKELQRVCSG